MFVLALGFGAVVSPLCTPCAALLVGLAAGYLVGVFDKPSLSSDAMKRGATAGAIAGAIAVLGQLVAAVINASFINPETINQLLGQQVLDSNTLWAYQLGGACCIGLFNVALMAGLGLAGAALWHSMNGPKQPQFPQQPNYPA